MTGSWLPVAGFARLLELVTGWNGRLVDMLGLEVGVPLGPEGVDQGRPCCCCGWPPHPGPWLDPLVVGTKLSAKKSTSW